MIVGRDPRKSWLQMKEFYWDGRKSIMHKCVVGFARSCDGESRKGGCFLRDDY